MAEIKEGGCLCGAVRTVAATRRALYAPPPSARALAHSSCHPPFALPTSRQPERKNDRDFGRFRVLSKELRRPYLSYTIGE